MATAEVTLTDEEHSALEPIPQRTGKTPEQVVHDAVRQYLAHMEPTVRQRLLQQARGIWRDRADLPVVSDLRREFERRG